MHPHALVGTVVAITLLCALASPAPAQPAGELQALRQAHKAAFRIFKKGNRYRAALTAYREYFAKKTPLTRKTAGLYNDLGFFMEQGGLPGPAVTLLRRVVKAFPGRTVAQLNLADAYFKQGFPVPAADRYRRYDELMRKAGKAPRIPKRVPGRVSIPADGPRFFPARDKAIRIKWNNRVANIDLASQIGSSWNHSYKFLFIQETNGALHAVFTVRGYSAPLEQAQFRCGAAEDTDLIWLRLGPALQVEKIQLFPFISCFGGWQTGEMVEANDAITASYEDFGRNVRVILICDKIHPERGIVKQENSL